MGRGLTAVAPPAAEEAAAAPHRTWRIVGASVAGPKRAADEPCEDSHAWAQSGDTLVVAVADGAGSARLAAAGSHLAATFAVEHTAWLLDEGVSPGLELLQDSLGATRRALVHRSRSLGCPLKDLSTTLALLVAGPGGTAAVQVGDGVVVVDDGEMRTLAAAAESEYLNETVFLTSRSWRKATTAGESAAPASAVALSTDGLALLAVDRETSAPHPGFFGPLLAHCRRGGGAEQLAKFLGSARVADRTDDDVTVVLATFA